MAPTRSVPGVEPGHELAAGGTGGTGGSEILVAVRQAVPEPLVVLSQLGDQLLQLVDVVGLVEPELPPYLLAESFGQSVLKLADADGEPDGALVGSEQVSLQPRRATP